MEPTAEPTPLRLQVSPPDANPGLFRRLRSIEARLIIELDGGQHADQVEYDLRRTEVIERAGWRVLRFWNSSVVAELDEVLDTIALELQVARGIEPLSDRP